LSNLCFIEAAVLDLQYTRRAAREVFALRRTDPLGESVRRHSGVIPRLSRDHANFRPRRQLDMLAFRRPVHLRGSPYRVRSDTSFHALRIPPRGGHSALRSTRSSGAFRCAWLGPTFAFVPVWANLRKADIARFGNTSGSNRLRLCTGRSTLASAVGRSAGRLHICTTTLSREEQAPRLIAVAMLSNNIHPSTEREPR
jgi:hypothetical protein